MNATEVSIPQVSLFEPLNALDRCDTCSAAALVRVVRQDKDLVFCGHHSDLHAITLASTGWQVLEDARHRED